MLFISCNSNKKGAEEITVFNLQQSFINKDESRFLNQFPKDLKEFNSYFGWNAANNKPQELYGEANAYIDYWFELLQNNHEHEKTIITICSEGKWQPDAINYFQDKTLAYIKKKNKYHLINDLNDEKARAVLFFLYDSPNPVFDEDFHSHLSPSKQQLVGELFESVFKDKELSEKSSINTINPEDFSGEYQLLDGFTYYSNADEIKYYKSAIIFEKLSNTDYGYYYVDKIKEVSPIGYHGVIRQLNGKFYNLGIKENTSKNENAEGNSTGELF
ncbi:hypothetical protein, partial [Yeosuana marina]|uniref:hypothetical protein n=1 Tax=Yeosuana marina TaxID=1565536 RepID=UPI0030C8BC2C